MDASMPPPPGDVVQPGEGGQAVVQGVHQLSRALHAVLRKRRQQAQRAVRLCPDVGAQVGVQGLQIE